MLQDVAFQSHKYSTRYTNRAVCRITVQTFEQIHQLSLYVQTTVQNQQQT